MIRRDETTYDLIRKSLIPCEENGIHTGAAQYVVVLASQGLVCAAEAL